MKRERVREILRGAAVALAAAVVLCAGGAALVSNEILGEEWMGYLSAGILTLSGFSGAMVCPDLMEAALSGVGAWMLLTAAGACTNGFSVAGAGVTLLAILGGSGAGILLKLRQRASGRNRRKTRIVKLNKKLH